MLFNSVQFAAFLAALVCLLLLARGQGARIALLVGGSYVFYGAWDARFCALLFAYTLIGWFCGNALHAAPDGRRRTLILAAGVGLALSGLAFFKYANFIAGSLVALLGLPTREGFSIALPVGISFFTFEVISYLVDIYRRDAQPARRFSHFALFMAFFPRLVAGPIIRASDFLPQVLKPIAFERTALLAGGALFLQGLVLKVVGADNLSVFVDAVYADVGAYSARTLGFAAACYSAQIFADFCGYSLMGIGLARALGFRLPPNFNLPYVATSIADFWHRWHISLSTWLRDYLYIPLGGSRHGEARTLVNLGLTMVLGGLWHGASWNFVAWGLCHGLALIAHRLWSRASVGWSVKATLPYGIASWLVTLSLVTLLWIPFRSPDFGTTWLFLGRLLSGADGIDWIHTPSLAILVGMAAWHLGAVLRPHLLRFEGLVPRSARLLPGGFLAAAGAVLLLLMFGQQNASPFIYFHF